MMQRNSSPSLKKNDKLRLQGNVADCYSKLEKINNSSKRIKDLFRPKANQLRERIRQQCEELLLDESLINSKKSIEIIWKHCYHNFMQFFKKNKKTIKQDEFSLLVAYFQSGTGYFYSFLLKFSNDYSDKLSLIVPEFELDPFEEDKKRLDSHLQQIANQCIHRLLICLGDLYRYLDILGEENCRLLATKWYNSAILFDSKCGMPFNQLGTLAGNDNYNLNSVYYYIRSLNCKKPFDTSEENLKFIFNLSKNSLNEPSILNSTNSECVYLVKRCIIEFIHLINLFWFETNDLHQLEKYIETSLKSFNQAIQLKCKPSNARKPTYLSPEIVFHLTVILIILNQKFKFKSFQGDQFSSTLNSATIGFILNFLFYLSNSMNKQIKEKNIVERSSSLNNRIDKQLNGLTNNKKTSSSLFKLRRKANLKLNSNDNEDNLSTMLDEYDDDDLNELEETALSTIDALEMSSDMSETGSFCDDDSSSNSFLTSATSEDENSQHNSNNSSSNNTVSITYEISRFLAYLYNESILPSIKLLVDWLTINEHLFDTYYQAFDSLFGNFVDLLNQLIELEDKALKSNENLNKFRYTYNWKQDYPLTIDIAIMNLETFKDYHKMNLNFDNKLNSNLTEEESGFLCIQSIIAFGHHISGNLSKNRIEFNHTSNRFNLIDKNDLKCTKFNNDDIILNGFDFGSPSFMKDNFSGNFITEQLNNDIIPNVSHLWLDKPNLVEIKVNGFGNTQSNNLKNNSNLYNSNLNQNSNKQNNKQSSINRFLPYVLLDITAYSDYLHLVKELFETKKYFIVVPSIILKDLDKKRKNSYDLKDAYNWIQSIRQTDSKYLRYLKSEERQRINNIQYPLKQEKTSYDFHILLEHCHYLNRKDIAKYNETGLKNGIDDKIILLYGENNCFPINYEQLLDKIGVKSQDLNSFMKNIRLTNDKT